MAHTGMSYPTNTLDHSCRRDLKKLLQNSIERKQWLIDNRDTIHSSFEIYEKFYEAVGRVELDIISYKAEIREEKRAKKLIKKGK